MDMVRRLEDAGAAAITMHSLFEEQLAMDAEATWHALEAQAYSHPEAESYFPRAADFALGPDEYLEQIRRIKAAVRVPVIASLNGMTGEGWTGYARLIEQAGADALELNVYVVAADPIESGAAVERRLLDATAAVRSSVDAPGRGQALAVLFVGVAPGRLARWRRRRRPGAVQPLLPAGHRRRELDVVPRLRLSDSSELLLRVRWLAVLSGRVRASLAASGGVHTARGRGQGDHGRRPRRSARLRAARARARAPAGVREGLSAGWRSTSTRRSPRCAAA